MSRHSALILFALLFTACANPDYITPEELNNQKLQSPSENCALRFPNTQICVKAQWASAPSSTRPGELAITLSPEFPGVFSALLWMPSMGHGSAPVKIESLEQGRYRLTNMYFIMPGDWDVRLFLKNAAGEVVDQLFISLMVP